MAASSPLTRDISIFSARRSSVQVAARTASRPWPASVSTRSNRILRDFVSGGPEHRPGGIVEGKALRRAEADAQPLMQVMASAHQPVIGIVGEGEAFKRGEVEIFAPRRCRPRRVQRVAAPARGPHRYAGPCGMGGEHVVGGLLHLRAGARPGQFLPALQGMQETRGAIGVVTGAGQGGDALASRLDFLLRGRSARYPSATPCARSRPRAWSRSTSATTARHQIRAHLQFGTCRGMAQRDMAISCAITPATSEASLARASRPRVTVKPPAGQGKGVDCG